MRNDQFWFVVWVVSVVMVVGWGMGQRQQMLRAEAERQLALVAEVIDGDTILLQDGRQVRYIGMDTSEKGECYSQEAAERNTELIQSGKVSMEADVLDKDGAGRLLRYVYVDGRMVNLVLVDEGYARVISHDPNLRYQGELIAIEESAKKWNRGLWGDCELVPFAG